MALNLDKQHWDQKVIELGGSILQSWDWGEFQKSLGYKIDRLASDEYACLAVTTPLPMGKSYVYCPRGPVGNVSAALDELKKFSEDNEILFVRIEPQQPADLPQSPKETQPTRNWMVDLKKTEQELLMGMKPKTRYNLNLATRKQVSVREGDKQDLVEVYKLFLETAHRAKFKLHPQNYYWQMVESLPKQVKILVAEYKGQILSGMLLGLYGDTASFLHGGSKTHLREVMAPYLMHWEAMKVAKAANMQLYDFGGISAQSQTHSSWEGITRFKKSFGGFEVVYPGSFDLIFSPVWYNVYKQARLARKLLKNL